MDTLDIWDMQMAAYGTKVLEARKNFIKQVNEIISDIHFKLTGGKKEFLSLMKRVMEICLWRRH